MLVMCGARRGSPGSRAHLLALGSRALQVPEKRCRYVSRVAIDPTSAPKAASGGLQWVPTAPTSPGVCASPTTAPGGRTRSGEVGRHQRKAAHACADFCAVHARRWSCSPSPPLRSCSWPASAGALLISIERKIPGAVGQHALGGAGPAGPLGAALRGQGREQCSAPRNQEHKFSEFAQVMCVTMRPLLGWMS